MRLHLDYQIDLGAVRTTLGHPQAAALLGLFLFLLKQVFLWLSFLVRKINPLDNLEFLPVQSQLLPLCTHPRRRLFGFFGLVSGLGSVEKIMSVSDNSFKELLHRVYTSQNSSVPFEQAHIESVFLAVRSEELEGPIIFLAFLQGDSEVFAVLRHERRCGFHDLELSSAEFRPFRPEEKRLLFMFVGKIQSKGLQRGGVDRFLILYLLNESSLQLSQTIIEVGSVRVLMSEEAELRVAALFLPYHRLVVRPSLGDELRSLVSDLPDLRRWNYQANVRLLIWPLCWQHSISIPLMSDFTSRQQQPYPYTHSASPQTSPLQSCLRHAVNRTIEQIRRRDFSNSFLNQPQTTPTKSTHQRPSLHKTNSSSSAQEIFSFMSKHFKGQSANVFQFARALIKEYQFNPNPCEDKVASLAHLVSQTMGDQSGNIDYSRLIELTKEGGLRGLLTQLNHQLEEAILPSQWKNLINVIQQFAQGLVLALQNKIYAKFRKEMKRMIETYRLAQQATEHLNAIALESPLLMQSASLRKKVLFLQKENQTLKSCNLRLNRSLEELKAKLIKHAFHNQNQYVQAIQPTRDLMNPSVQKGVRGTRLMELREKQSKLQQTMAHSNTSSNLSVLLRSPRDLP